MKLRFSLFCIITAMVAAIPASVYASPESFYTCNVRSHPTLRANGYLLGQYIYKQGDIVTLVAYPDSPKGILAAQGRHAYANKDLSFSYNPSTRKGTLEVKKDRTKFSCTAHPLAKGRILEPAILRASSTIESKRLRTLPTGTRLKIIEVSSKTYRNAPWLKVQDDEGRDAPVWQGYVWSGTVCLAENGTFKIRGIKDCAR